MLSIECLMKKIKAIVIENQDFENPVVYFFNCAFGSWNMNTQTKGTKSMLFELKSARKVVFLLS